MKIQNIILSLQFLPLTLFLVLARIYNFTHIGWKYGFIASSLLAVVQTFFLVSKKVVIDRFLLAINLFLLGGALGFIIDWSPLLNFYEHYQYIVLFMAVVLVGFITTFYSEHGFIGAPSGNSRAIKIQSFKLLLSAIGALLFLMFIKSSLPVAAFLFILLKFFQNFLLHNIY